MDFSYKDIKEIKSAKIHKDKGIVRFEAISNNGERVGFMAEYGKFCEWLHKNKDSYNNVFEDFINEFFESSKEEQRELSEIIDQFGNIDLDDDKPSNANSKEIGSSKFDTDRVIQQGVPKRFRFYQGNYGMGALVW